MKPFAGLFVLIAAASTAASVGAAPAYEMGLDAERPTRVDFSLIVPAGRDVALTLPKSAAKAALTPKCGSTPLQQTGSATWLKPKDCDVISWTASLYNLDNDPFDGSRPTSGWSERHHLWLLTGGLPWLRVKGQPTAPVRIHAQIAGRQFVTASQLPADASIPVAIVIGRPVRRFRADAFMMNVYGEVPSAPELNRLERSLVSTLAQWRSDLFQQRSRAPNHLNYVWFGPSPSSEPGIFASANSDAILIQYIRDPKSSDPDAKLAVGIFGTGAHEAFHAMGAVSGAPAWANESLAMYFAYIAARRHLSGKSFRLFSQLVDAPTEKPILAVEAQVEKGDQVDYGDFYSKGTRLWEAIDKVLTVKPNGTGKLAALIKQTNGLHGLNWSDSDAIAAYFDRVSGGRAGAIVRCYLVENGCSQSKMPNSCGTLSKGMC